MAWGMKLRRFAALDVLPAGTPRDDDEDEVEIVVKLLKFSFGQAEKSENPAAEEMLGEEVGEDMMIMRI